MINFSCLTLTLTPLSIVQLLIALLLAICFLQSGFDKIIDYKGNLGWLKEHFKSSMLKNLVPFLLTTITVFELVGGFLCLVGIFDFFINGTKMLLFYGFFINAISLISLFLGQRLAKDYDGAAVLIGYFILTIIGILSFSFI